MAMNLNMAGGAQGMMKEGSTLADGVDEAVLKNIGRRFAFPKGTPAIVLTDDFNPVDVRDSKLRESLRREILETTDWGMLLETG